MGRHSANNAAPTREWIEGVLGKRHRLSTFHDPSTASADQSELLWMFPTAADVDDYAHRDEAYRNLGTSAALHVVRDVFADFDSYVLRLSEQRVVEHRPLRAADALHSDVFIESHDTTTEGDGEADVYSVRVVFTDSVGALVFTNFATFVGRLECTLAQDDESIETDVAADESDATQQRGSGFAANS